ncbi:hypothetical protein [Rubrobacter indicoceani]|uniref:hypothetical protein n=1 Tax=Rubrobacter indicoceani TaxID=2051957 RepID=UPI0013C46C66|nr:hypothetical protein [Rubrobacter indicoceani]
MYARRNIPVFVVAIVVSAFVSVYPAVDCRDQGYPSGIHSALGVAATACVAGVLSVVSSLLRSVSVGHSPVSFRSRAMSSQTFTSALFRPPKA